MIKERFFIVGQKGIDITELKNITNYEPVGAEIYFSFKCGDVVDMLNSLQPQLFNFRTSQEVCYVDINITFLIIIALK